MPNLKRLLSPTRFAAAVFALALIGLFAAGCGDDASPTAPALPEPPTPAPAPEPAPEPAPIQAGEVVDRETLKAFVEAAAAEAAAQIATAEDAYAFFDANFRPEGPWRQGEVYLFAHHLDGIQFFHAVTPETEGLDRSNIEDVNGVKLIQEILAAATAGGGYVEYRWPNPVVEGDEDTGSPKVSYAVPLTIGDLELSFGAGIYLPVTAADVLNRGNLRQFVERAAGALADHSTDRETAHAFLDANFRDEGEWRHLDIYVFVITMEGINFFQAPDPDWEGTDVSDSVDLNGVRLGEELLKAARAGGGFVEYRWDNPVVEGDEEDGSPKLAYAVPITVGDEPMLLGSGIYLDASEQ
jgi:signal transduction histidine kinase